ncbi:MAG: DUF2306 domain-containing protein [Rhodothermaceae bacterium]|nr:DUF2306 domain-containing protein [Rhodothermaceae bacterium]
MPSTNVDRAIKVGMYLLVVTVWCSALLFGLFILSFYFVALLEGNTAQWNEVLPGLYDSSTKSATLGIGVHFAAGGIILILGCIQLIEPLRTAYPGVHRWLGRIYVFASLLTAVGGLAFIFIKGTIGGLVMDIGFSGYGLLMFWAAIETFRHARARRFKKHRAWAIRLFALAIGSWLYRMDYGFWFLFTDGIGHTDSFNGPFDYFMSFFFYLPNLLVAELFIRRKELLQSTLAKWLAIAGLYAATAFLVLATYFFTLRYWGPAIVDLFTFS